MADRDLAFTLQGYLSTIESRLSDAAVALHLFEQAQGSNVIAIRDRRDADSYDQQSLDEFRRLASEYGKDARSFLMELEKRTLEAKRQRWLAGELPRAYTSRLQFMYARMFLFSLSDIGKLLTRVGTSSGIPTQTTAAVSTFEAAFPMLKGLRDSSAHVDERVAGRARGRSIIPKPVDNSFVKAGGLLFVENLFGNRFSGTIDTGELAEIEVSAVTLRRLQECFQRLLNSLPWSGPARHYPD